MIIDDMVERVLNALVGSADARANRTRNLDTAELALGGSAGGCVRFRQRSHGQQIVRADTGEGG